MRSEANQATATCRNTLTASRKCNDGGSGYAASGVDLDISAVRDDILVPTRADTRKMDQAALGVTASFSRKVVRHG